MAWQRDFHALFTEPAEKTECKRGPWGSEVCGCKTQVLDMNGLTRNESRKRSYATTLRGHVLQRSEASAAIEFQGPDFRALMRRELAAAWAACGMFECVALGYLGVSSALILFFAENLAHPVRLIVTQALVATV